MIFVNMKIDREPFRYLWNLTKFNQCRDFRSRKDFLRIELNLRWSGRTSAGRNLILTGRMCSLPWGTRCCAHAASLKVAQAFPALDWPRNGTRADGA